MNAANTEEALPEIWAGQLESVQLDVLAHRVTLSIHVLDSRRAKDEELTTHQLVLHGVTDFHFFHDTEGPWEHAEVSEIYVEGSAGQYSVEIWLNTMDNQMLISAKAISLDGQTRFPTIGR